MKGISTLEPNHHQHHIDSKTTFPSPFESEPEKKVVFKSVRVLMSNVRWNMAPHPHQHHHRHQPEPPPMDNLSSCHNRKCANYAG